MEERDYIEAVLDLRDRVTSRAQVAYEAATARQMLDAADRFAESGTVLLETEILSRTVRDVYADGFNTFSVFTYNWLTARKAEPDEETRKRMMLILINFFFANLQLLVQQMTRTSRIDIFAIVQAGVEQDKTNVQIAQDIRRAAPGLAARRSMDRASTSTLESSSLGGNAAAREVKVITKVWWTTLDERTRRGERGFDHAAAHLQEVPVQNPFIVSGEMMNYPGDSQLGASVGNRINCRCVPIFNLPNPNGADN